MASLSFLGLCQIMNFGSLAQAQSFGASRAHSTRVQSALSHSRQFIEHSPLPCQASLSRLREVRSHRIALCPSHRVA